MMNKFATLAVCSLISAGSFAIDERPVVPAGIPVQVRFQLKSANSSSWSTSSATLKGSVSESMMVNELSRRYPNSQIRILAANCGKTVSVSVRYQISRNGKSWTTGTAALTNALTESMARNQLSQKYPNTEIRILGITSR